jgi:hypothetical protein
MKAFIYRNKLILSIAGAVLLLLLLPIQLTSSFDITGKVMPAREWYLISDANGGFRTVLRNHAQQRTEMVRYFEAGRGDILSLTMAGLDMRSPVSESDNVGSLVSRNMLQEQAAMQVRLDQAEAEIALLQSMEKPQVIEEQRQRLEMARLQLQQANREYVRDSESFRSGILSQEEFELSESRFNSARQKVRVEEAQLAIVETGERVARIEAAKRLRDSLLREKNLIDEKITEYMLFAPFNGFPRLSSDNDTLLILQSAERVLAVPVLATQVAELTGDSVHVSLAGLGDFLVTLHFDKNNTRRISGRSYFTAVIAFPADKEKLAVVPFGQLIPLELAGSAAYPAEYFISFVKKVFSRS